MGTRSLTKIYDEGRPIACLYRQYDGYPEGMGQDLIDFLTPFTITNGLKNTPLKTANGLDCLAAQLVAHFKGETAGQFYLMHPDTENVDEDYEYRIWKSDSENLMLQCFDVTCAHEAGPRTTLLIFTGEPKTLILTEEKLA